MTPAFHPLRDQVLIEPIRNAERFGRLVNGLFLPNNPQKEKGACLWEGRVIATGPGDKLAEIGMQNGTPTGLHRFLNPDGSPQPCNCKAGDRVLYYRRTSGFSPGDVEIDGKEYAVVLEEQHIAAVIEE